MDGYRQTLLGRALADALREIEATGGESATTIDGDAVFALFDKAVSEELAAGLRASGRRRKKHKADSATAKKGGTGNASEEDAGVPPPVFTHRSLALDARLRSFNRFEDKWSLQAAVPSGGLVLDHVPLRWGSDRSRHAADGEDQEAQDEEREGGAEEGGEAREAGDGALPMLVKLQQLEGGGKPSTK